MKKILATALISLALLNFVNAQSAKNNDIIDPENLAQLQKLPKQTRDSLISSLKDSKNKPKNNSVKINGKDMSAQMAGPMNKFSTQMTELMIGVLSTDDPAIVEKNQDKYHELAEQLDYDMDALSEKLEYEEKRQKLVDDYNERSYENAKERREAKKEMKEDLRELKDDYKEKVKDNRERFERDMKRKARNKRNVNGK